MNLPEADYDGAWKEALEQFLEKILQRFFPETHALIDWSRPFEFLEQELKKVLPVSDGAPEKPWRVDKLIRVFLKDGGERWLLIHLEVQSFAEEDFAARIFGYFCRLQAAFGRDVLPLVILADANRSWHPEEYRYEMGKVSVRLRFDTCKLLDLAEELEADPGIPSIVARAQLAAHGTARNAEARLRAKWRLTRLLYESGYSAEEVRRVFIVIDWMMTLPRELAFDYEKKIVDYETEHAMPYVSSIEQIGIEKGLEKGLERGLERGREEGLEEGLERGLERGLEAGKRNLVNLLLEKTVGEVPEELAGAVERLSSGELDSLAVAVIRFESAADLRRWLEDRA
jgi:hypothetical protein